jgi:DNA-binding transcriptional regulator WhiA
MDKKPISFAQLAKEEAASKAPWSDEGKRALLSAFIRINGYLRLTKGEEKGSSFRANPPRSPR